MSFQLSVTFFFSFFLNRTSYYREYFQETGIFENQVYPGIRQMLKALKDDGRILWVATSKPEPFAQRILEHFDLDGYFSCVAGASMDETRVKKGEVIAYAIERMGAERREDRSDPDRSLRSAAMRPRRPSNDRVTLLFTKQKR